MVTAAGAHGKTKKHTKVVVLKLSPSSLRQFSSNSKSSSSNASTPANDFDEDSTLKPEISIDNASEPGSTPVPGQDAATPDASKKRKTPSAAPKKSLLSAVDTMPKPRGKPGPKKKPRLEDGTIDHGNKPPVVSGAAAHKLGPKANTGAINAGLRALDRSGRPCRKWDRKGFQLKSFTGIVWELSSWKGDERSTMSEGRDGESTSENRDASMHSSSDAKQNGSDVAMSNAGDRLDSMAISTPAASSPAPMPQSTAIAA